MTARTRKHNLSKLTATGNVERKTPPEIFAWLDAQFSFDLDVASTHENALCRDHFTKADNGLAQSWHGRRAFMNPPFGKTIGEWVEKARVTCVEDPTSLVACVLPARVDAEWWRAHVQRLTPQPSLDQWPPSPPRALMTRQGVLVLEWPTVRVHLWHFGERVKFDGLKSGAPFPTSVVVFSGPQAPRPKPYAGTLDRPSFGEVWP